MDKIFRNSIFISSSKEPHTMKRKQSDFQTALRLHQKELKLRSTPCRETGFGVYCIDKAFKHLEKCEIEECTLPENVFGEPISLNCMQVPEI
jgi:hypothetical protein